MDLDRAAFVISIVGGISVAAALLAAAWSMGYAGPWVVVGCGVAGALIAWPSGRIAVALLRLWRGPRD